MLTHEHVHFEKYTEQDKRIINNADQYDKILPTSYAYLTWRTGGTKRHFEETTGRRVNWTNHNAQIITTILEMTKQLLTLDNEPSQGIKRRRDKKGKRKAKHLQSPSVQESGH